MPFPEIDWMSKSLLSFPETNIMHHMKLPFVAVELIIGCQTYKVLKKRPLYATWFFPSDCNLASLQHDNILR